ncbi:MAG: PP2C family protein-serine/threonine phosphatase [Planctomycetota bacterium]
MSFFSRKKSSETPQQPEVSTTTFLTGDLNKDSENVRNLLEAIADVGSTIDLHEVLVSIVDKSIQVTKAERGLLMLLPTEDGDGQPEIRVAREKGSKDIGGAVRFSRSIVNRVLSEKRPICTIVNSDEEALEVGQSVFDLKLQTVMCVPLEVKDRLIGAIYVDSRAGVREFSEADLAFFSALASQLSIALETARLLEQALMKERLAAAIGVARDIQRRLLPSDPEGIPGFSIAGWSIPCEEASGDFYDFVPLPGGRLGVALGDVSGHGVGAALMMSETRALLRSQILASENIEQVLAYTNKFLNLDLKGEGFVSLQFGILDPGQKTYRYGSAGQTPGILMRADGSLLSLENTGPALGMVSEAAYLCSDPIALESGDYLLLYTDGLCEARGMDGQTLFGRERLIESLRKHRGAKPAEIIQHIVADVEAFAGDPVSQDDDLTLVVLEAD